MTVHIYRRDITLWASSFMLYLGPKIPVFLKLIILNSVHSRWRVIFIIPVEMWQAQNFTRPCLIPVSLGRSEWSSWAMNRVSIVSSLSSPLLCGSTRGVGLHFLFLLLFSHSVCHYNLLKMSCFLEIGSSFLLWAAGWEDLMKHHPHESHMAPPMALMMISNFSSVNLASVFLVSGNMFKSSVTCFGMEMGNSNLTHWGFCVFFSY